MLKTGSINHIALTVEKLEDSKEFYNTLLGKLGYSYKGELENLQDRSDSYFGCAFWGNDELDTYINLWEKNPNSSVTHNRYNVGLHHVAFHVSTRKELDDIYEWAKSVDCEILDPPNNYPDYGNYYYSFYLKELNGIKIEIVTQEQVSKYP